MTYPDELPGIEMVEINERDPRVENIEVEEIPIKEQGILEGFASLDVQGKIDAMLGQPISREGKIDNSPLFVTGDKLLGDVPVIDTEEKIRQILDF